MDEDLQYRFDVFGYITLPGAVDAQLLEGLRKTFRQPAEQFDPVAPENHPLHWSPAWRTLLDLPAVSPVLEALVGNHELRAFRQERDGESYLPTYRLDHINVHNHVKQGYEGMHLHGGWKSSGGSQYFRYHDGRFYNGLVVVAVELFDTHANGGGFCCIPGSHKANVDLPAEWTAPGSAPEGLVCKVPAAAGDVIVFTEALVHGTAAWKVDEPRLTAFYKYSPHGTSWSADYLDIADFEGYADMDDRRLALLEAPNARYRGRPGAFRPKRRRETS